MPINGRMDKMMTHSHNGKLDYSENEQTMAISNNYTNIMLHRSETQMNVYFMILLVYS